MKNSITAKLVFSFRGEVHTLTAELDLDEEMEKRGRMPLMHDRLAAAGGFGPYSYEYEVLQSEELTFENATGLAAEFVDDQGRFDSGGFEARWHELRVVETLRPVAERLLGVSDLDAEPKLVAALLEAYRLGREAAR